jgi:hypothetical protein
MNTTKRLPWIVGAVDFERAVPPITPSERRGRFDLRTVTRQSVLPPGLVRGEGKGVMLLFDLTNINSY